jgi:two-component system chemotaxis response regulator CheB
VLVCPGGRCIDLLRERGGFFVRVASPNPEDRYVPSADRAFTSAASAAGRRVTAVVLTGMGDDGSRGIVDVKRAGGTIVVQSPDEAILDGMPRAALRSGVVDLELPLKLLSERLASLLGSE